MEASIPKERRKTEIVFYIDPDSIVGSRLDGKEQVPGHFDLQQYKMAENSTHVPVAPAYYDIASLQSGTKEILQPIGPLYSLHPMDMVTLVALGPDGKPFSTVVPAIFVKDIAYHREWEDLMLAFRLGMDLFIVAVSVATLVGAPGAFMAVVSIVDLGLASADLAVQAFKEQIAAMKGGKEFLETWEKVFAVGGLLVSAVLLPNLLQSGFSLLAKVAVHVRGKLLEMLAHVRHGRICDICEPPKPWPATSRTPSRSSLITAISWRATCSASWTRWLRMGCTSCARSGKGWNGKVFAFFFSDFFQRDAEHPPSPPSRGEHKGGV